MNNVIHNISTREFIAAKLAIYSGIFFTVQFAILHIIEPEYNSPWHFISEYMLGEFGWLMNTAFLWLSVCMASTLIATVSLLHNWYGYLGAFILGLASLGIAMAGIFTTDPVSLGSQTKATFSGTMHVIGASLDYTPVAAILISLSLLKNQSWQDIRMRLMITAWLTVVLMFLFMATLPFDGIMTQESVAGLAGRFLIMSYIGWLVPVGLQCVKLQKKKSSLRLKET
jgi:hypothetical protein